MADHVVRTVGRLGRRADAGGAVSGPCGDREWVCRPDHYDERRAIPLPTNPVQFDEQPVIPPGAPEHGQHTEEVLMDAGIDWETIEKLKGSRSHPMTPAP